MWIRSSGQISENVFQLTTPFSTNALFSSGAAAALIDASVAAASDRLVEELTNTLSDMSELKFILISHAHFDHLGGIPALRKLVPDVELVASPATAELLRDAAVLKETYDRNRAVTEASGMKWDVSEKEWKDALEVHHPVGDGDKIDLAGGVEVTVIATPGHTSDSVSFYLRPDDIVAGGEALGHYRGRDKLDPAFLTNYGEYLRSLDKLASLNLRGVLLPHGGALTGDLAKNYFMAARAETERFREQVKARVETGQTIDEIFETTILDWVNDNIAPDGPFVDSQQNALRTMIELAAKE